MTVMVGLRMDVDPERFAQVAAENEEALESISEHARGKGCVHHMFMAGDGHVMVADEWDSAESFETFFAEAMDQIGPLIQQAGVTEQPQPVFWRPMDTVDRF